MAPSTSSPFERRHRPVRLAGLLALMLWAGAAAAQLYSWKDETGKVHYSDQPPPGKTPARKLNPAPLNVDTSGPQNKAAAEKIPAEKPKVDAAADEKAKACEKAKADQKALEDKPRRTAARAGGGFQVLDAAERAAEEEAVRKAIEQNCR